MEKNNLKKSINYLQQSIRSNEEKLSIKDLNNLLKALELLTKVHGTETII